MIEVVKVRATHTIGYEPIPKGDASNRITPCKIIVGQTIM